MKNTCKTCFQKLAFNSLAASSCSLAEKQDVAGVIVSVDFMKCFDRVEIPALISAMSYFNIGESYQKWIKTVYHKSKSCVTNQGFFMPWFSVTRSVKQRGPNSPYLFLLSAEFLAIELRKNPKIKGFMVKEIMRLFGQYADDMDLYLLGDKTSLQEAISTFHNFERQSGFKINYEKTTVYRIGSLRNSQAKYYSRNELNWVNTEINVLGVFVTDNKCELQKLNYEPIVKKADATLKRWADRNLSLMGKILIVNMLIGSLFVYKMSVLPAITQDIIQRMNKMIHAFLWNGKKAKIS